MKRDPDLIRTILLAVEATPAGEPISNNDIEAEGHDPVEVSEHVQLLHQAGFLEVTISQELKPRGSRTCFIRRITWNGHEYLDTIRDPRIWARTKDAVAKVGGATSVELIKFVATQFAKEALGFR